MTPPLTRRQRIGYALVLEQIRAEVSGNVIHESSLDAPVQFISNTIGWCGDERLDCNDRMTRARLALYLRALLRADAGDCGGRWQCRKCGRIDFAPGGCNDNYWCADDDMLWEQRIRPLWELAPVKP